MEWGFITDDFDLKKLHWYMEASPEIYVWEWQDEAHCTRWQGKFADFIELWLGYYMLTIYLSYGILSWFWWLSMDKDYVCASSMHCGKDLGVSSSVANHYTAFVNELYFTRNVGLGIRKIPDWLASLFVITLHPKILYFVDLIYWHGYRNHAEFCCLSLGNVLSLGVWRQPFSEYPNFKTVQYGQLVTNSFLYSEKRNGSELFLYFWKGKRSACLLEQGTAVL